MRSFNEFFIALGVVLLAFGLANSDDTPFAVAIAWAFPVTVWGLAEYLTAIKRYTLPSIVLAIFFTVSTGMLALQYLQLPPSDGASRIHLWDLPELYGEYLHIFLAMFLASIAFYVRFRLPFSLLLIVGSSIPLILLILDQVIGLPDKGVLNIALLFIGLIVFAVALRFDMSDRERLTRRSDCAFWLMLAAAPLIVHPVVSLVTKGSITGLAANATTLGIVAVFALVALIVDRRAFLVSTLIYLGATLVSGIGAIAGEGNALWVTLVVMGAAVVLLGVGWQTARAFVMRPLPASLASHFPMIRSS